MGQGELAPPRASCDQKFVIALDRPVGKGHYPVRAVECGCLDAGLHLDLLLGIEAFRAQQQAPAVYLRSEVLRGKRRALIWKVGLGADQDYAARETLAPQGCGRLAPRLARS